ncbi:MAG: DNA repair protein RadC [Bacteroidales bacterium]|nr:DNA repair protein RadC [Bacteroidales bacterium]
MNYTSIKNWAEEDRPREKLLQKGCSSLTETELLAIILGSGTKNESALDLAKKIFAQANNNLYDLGKFSINDFKQIKGIGEAKAVSLIATFELGRRRNLTESRKKDSIRSSREIFSIMQPLIGELKHEEFWAIYLNNSNVIITEKKISSGGITKTVVDTKLIAKHAIELLATGVIISHNHPSESNQPSREDKELTTQIRDALKLIDCRLLDHIIISGKNYYSFCDEGLL